MVSMQILILSFIKDINLSISANSMFLTSQLCIVDNVVIQNNIPLVFSNCLSVSPQNKSLWFQLYGILIFKSLLDNCIYLYPVLFSFVSLWCSHLQNLFTPFLYLSGVVCLWYVI